MESTPMAFGVLASSMTVSFALLVNRGHKFVTAMSTSSCQNGFIDISAFGSEVVCCDSLVSSVKELNEMCLIVNKFREIEKIMVSPLAAVFPLIPLLIAAVLSQDRLRRDADYGKRLLLRFILYAVTIIFRILVLYLAVNWIEKMVQGPPTEECWYSPYRPKNRCKDNFNIGDHLVLMMVQYIAIPMFELNAVKLESPKTITYFTVNFLAKMMVVLACLNIYISSAYFHTRAETSIGFILSVVTVFVPHQYVLRRYKDLVEGDTSGVTASAQFTSESTNGRTEKAD
mmetsp:Transcript_44038/g.171902  ORF Transcript_44038/g.171902 Transcript_44038/m.171902 type:complete len:286 (-) Transcript_44038:441-1298(-)